MTPIPNTSFSFLKLQYCPMKCISTSFYQQHTYCTSSRSYWVAGDSGNNLSLQVAVLLWFILDSTLIADLIKPCIHSLAISCEKLSLPRHNSVNAYLWDQWSVDHLRLGQTVMITTGNKNNSTDSSISLLKFVWIW